MCNERIAEQRQRPVVLYDESDAQRVDRVSQVVAAIQLERCSRSPEFLGGPSDLLRSIDVRSPIQGCWRGAPGVLRRGHWACLGLTDTIASAAFLK